MNIVRHAEFDCETFADVCRRQNVQVTSIVEMPDVPHVGFGGVEKSSYTSPVSGKTIFVLERAGQYAPDAFATEVWLTEDDFTEEDAVAFVVAHDLQRESEQRIQSMFYTFRQYPNAVVQEASWTSDPSGGDCSREEFEEAKRRYEHCLVKKASDIQVGDQVMLRGSGVFAVTKTQQVESKHATGAFLQYVEFGFLTNPVHFPINCDIDVIQE